MHRFLSSFLIIVSVVHNVTSTCPTRQSIETALNKSHIPGAAIIVVNATDILYEEAFGYQSLSPAKPIDLERSIFSLASISKTFIATAVMQLVEAGLVDLDTDVKRYLPESTFRIFHPNYTLHAITLRRLLSHSASIAVDASMGSFALSIDDTALDKMSLAEILSQVINPNSSSWLSIAPGSVYSYSNEGSSLAALVVEKVTNISFDRYVKEKIMKPLNIEMNKFGIRLTEFANREDVVKHYTYAPTANDLQIWRQLLPQFNITPLTDGFPTWVSFPFYSTSAYASGLFRTSARSLSKFLRMFVNNGSSLLSPQSIAQMRSVVGCGLIRSYEPPGFVPIENVSISLEGYGLSWNWVKLGDGRRYIGHQGSLPGARNWMLVNEKSTIGVIILTNGDTGMTRDQSLGVELTLADLHETFFRCYDSDSLPSSANHRYSLGFGLSLSLLLLTLILME